MRLDVDFSNLKELEAKEAELLVALEAVRSAVKALRQATGPKLPQHERPTESPDFQPILDLLPEEFTATDAISLAGPLGWQEKRVRNELNTRVIHSCSLKLISPGIGRRPTTYRKHPPLPRTQTQTP